MTLPPNGFIAYKQSEGGEVKTIRGTETDLLAGALSPFFPIGPSDIFELEVGSDFDVKELNFRITFSGQISSNAEAGFESISNDPALDNYYELNLQSGELARRAVVVRGSDVWQVVGYMVDDEVVTLLHDIYDPLGSLDITESSIIARLSSHSDGPGPVSWDEDVAIVEIGDYWLYFYYGDMPRQNLLIRRPEDVVAEIIEWLDQNASLSFFVVKNLTPSWESAELRNRLGQALTGAENFLSLSVKIESDQLAILMTKAIKMSADIGQVAVVLKSADHPLREKLVSYFESYAPGYPYWANEPIMPALDSHS